MLFRSVRPVSLPSPASRSKSSYWSKFEVPSQPPVVMRGSSMFPSAFKWRTTASCCFIRTRRVPARRCSRGPARRPRTIPRTPADPQSLRPAWCARRCGGTRGGPARFRHPGIHARAPNPYPGNKLRRRPLLRAKNLFSALLLPRRFLPAGSGCSSSRSWPVPAPRLQPA